MIVHADRMDLNGVSNMVLLCDCMEVHWSKVGDVIL